MGIVFKAVAVGYRVCARAMDVTKNRFTFYIFQNNESIVYA